jgi:hypothetical protein
MKNRIYLSLIVVALLCLTGWTVYAQRSSPARQAWEYKTWVFSTVGSGMLYEDGNQLPGSSTPVSRAPELGAQGWELVSVTSQGDYNLIYWFKRPK